MQRKNDEKHSHDDKASMFCLQFTCHGHQASGGNAVISPLFFVVLGAVAGSAVGGFVILRFFPFLQFFFFAYLALGLCVLCAIGLFTLSRKGLFAFLALVLGIVTYVFIRIGIGQANFESEFRDQLRSMRVAAVGENIESFKSTMHYVSILRDNRLYDNTHEARLQGLLEDDDFLFYAVSVNDFEKDKNLPRLKRRYSLFTERFPSSTLEAQFRQYLEDAGKGLETERRAEVQRQQKKQEEQAYTAIMATKDYELAREMTTRFVKEYPNSTYRSALDAYLTKLLHAREDAEFATIVAIADYDVAVPLVEQFSRKYPTSNYLGKLDAYLEELNIKKLRNLQRVNN